MHVVEDGPQRLRFYEPANWVLTIVGTFFVLIGLGVLHHLGARGTLTCSRDTGLCTVTTWRVTGTERHAFPVSHLQGGTLTEHPASKGANSYTVSIDTANGSVPLSPFSDQDHAHHDGIAERIDAFAADPQARTLEVHLGPSWLGIGFGLALNVFMIWLGLVGLTRTTYTFDATGRTLNCRRRGLLAGPGFTLDLGRVVGVRLDVDDRGKSTTHTLRLVLADGTAVELGDPTADGLAARHNADRVREFLRVPEVPGAIAG
jgi:hypothetical protein